MLDKTSINQHPTARLGLGCWTIGGPFWEKGQALGYGETDDRESIAAIKLAIEGGIRFFDTADVYGAGHSEKLLGQAIKTQRDQLTIATKFGFHFNERTKEVLGQRYDHRYIISACENSLRRLQCSHIDIYHLHIDGLALTAVSEIIDTLEYLIHQGKIKHYAWSTDNPINAKWMMQFAHCNAIQHRHNVLEPADEIIAICEQHQRMSINRSPLAMGLLATPARRQESPEADIRQNNPDWLKYFTQGFPNKIFTQKIQAIGEILKSDGRTLAAGALAWVWGSSRHTLPIPGFRNSKQVAELLKATEHGPLNTAQMREIANLLAGDAAVQREPASGEAQ